MTGARLTLLALGLLMAGCGDQPEVAVTGAGLVKLDAGGAPMPHHAGPWRCIHDTATGLTWEVKSDDEGLHHRAWTYTWRHPRDAPRGADGSCHRRATGRCDTAAFIAAVNRARLCGHGDWRLPTRRELSGLVDPDVPAPGPRTHPAAFPHTARSSYWTASADDQDPARRWGVSFASGATASHHTGGAFYVRLVRGPSAAIARAPDPGLH